MHRSIVRFALAALLAAALTSQASAVVLSWTFDAGNLSIDQGIGGTGTLDYKDAGTAGVTTFGITGLVPPPIAGNNAIYLYHPQLPNGGNAGYQLAYTNVFPNGGGAYVNDYTMIFDMYVPGPLDWTAIFNTDPNNGNDADFYVDPSGALGIGALGYAPSGTIAADRWHRVGFVHDRTANRVTYWVDGANVFTGAAGPTDGRFSLYSSLDAIPAHVNLHGEGDGSGNYTQAMYLNNFVFSDTVFGDALMRALGGPTAGATIPEPGTCTLATLGMLLVIRRRRRK